jgi:tetratricopeptide (TPR) repeat protein
VTVLVYSSSFANGFLNWDDPGNVTQNEAIRAITWEHLKIWFTRPLLGMYSPLVYISFAIDYLFGGMQPSMYHATNLLLHLLNVVLVFLIVFRLSSSTLASAIVTSLFAVHPMNVAAVTPVSVRSSLLFSCFYLAAYLAYLRYLGGSAAGMAGLESGTTEAAGPFSKDAKRWRWLWLSLVLFVLAALAKSAAVVFSLLLVATDYYYRRPITWRKLLEKWPFFVVSVVFGMVTFVFREDTAAMVTTTDSPLLERLLLACYSVAHYLFRLIVPTRLSAFYPYPVRVGGHLPIAVYLAPVILVAAAWLAMRLKPYRRLMVFGGLFFLIHILLVVKIIPLGAEWVADRYVYLASIGIFFILAEVLRQLKPEPRKVGVTVAAGLVGILAVASFQRSAVWKDDMAFYSGIIGSQPGAAVAYSNRAAARIRNASDAEGALADCDSAIRLDPEYADAYHNRATAKMMLRKYGEALADSSAAIKLNPSRAEFFRTRADAQLATGDLAGAIADSEKALELDPHGPETFLAYQSRGIARIKMNDRAGAIADFSKAIELNPQAATAYQNRGNARVLAGDDAGALADYDKTVEVSPTFATAYYYRGMLKERRGDRTGSCGDYRKAAQLKVPGAEAAVQDVCPK